MRYICSSPGYGVSIIIYIYFFPIILTYNIGISPAAENLLGAMHSAKIHCILEFCGLLPES